MTALRTAAVSLFFCVVSDRLTELQRQRALIQEQLAWLDREIAAEKGKAEPLSPPSPAAGMSPPRQPQPLRETPAASQPRPGPGAAAAAPLAPAPAVDAEAILAKYETDPTSLKTDVRKGCLLYFAIAFAVVGLGVAILYFYSRSHEADRPQPPPPAKTRTAP